MNDFGMNMSAPNIKILIRTYENRIRELKEIIKQKDSEIFSLQQKLNKKNEKNYNFFGNIDWQLDLVNDNISININGKIKCPKDAKTYLIKDKLINSYFTFNHKSISFNNTLEDNGIKNGSMINISDFLYNIDFIDRGTHEVITVDGDCSIKQAIKYYSEKIGKKGLYQKILHEQIIFTYKNNKLNALDETPIKKVFNYIRDPFIIVLGGIRIDLMENY